MLAENDPRVSEAIQTELYHDVDRVTQVGIVKDGLDDEITVTHHRLPIPEFDKPELDERIVALKLLPNYDDLPEKPLIPGVACPEDIVIRFVSWRKQNLAIGSYVYLLEQHDVDPTDALADLQSISRKLVAPYRDYVANLTKDGRRNLLEGLIDERLKSFNTEPVDPRLSQWQKVCTTGSYRSTQLSDGAAELISDAVNRIEDHDPRSCYYTTLQVFRELEHRDDVRYCEGIVMPEHLGVPTDHAWLEVDNEVAEVTWPYHTPDPGEATYYGTHIDRATMNERLQHRPPTTTLLLNKDEYIERLQLHK